MGRRIEPNIIVKTPASSPENELKVKKPRTDEEEGIIILSSDDDDDSKTKPDMMIQAQACTSILHNYGITKLKKKHYIFKNSTNIYFF